MDETGPGRDSGGDYEYDEAHDETAEGSRVTPAPRRVMPPPTVNLDQGGDYGHDEAHDFGIS